MEKLICILLMAVLISCSSDSTSIQDEILSEMIEIGELSFEVNDDNISLSNAMAQVNTAGEFGTASAAAFRDLESDSDAQEFLIINIRNTNQSTIEKKVYSLIDSQILYSPDSSENDPWISITSSVTITSVTSRSIAGNFNAVLQKFSDSLRNQVGAETLIISDGLFNARIESESSNN